MHYHIRIERMDTGRQVREHWHTDNVKRIPGLIASVELLISADIKRVMRCHRDDMYREV